ncbi:MAG: hypothetical protein NTV22_18560 [bacterium]|nr:hypothetical protein [bacterium]
MKIKPWLLFISSLTAFLAFLGSGALCLFYWYCHSIGGDGIVKITSHAVDVGDRIALKVRVENVDTTRYLSNFGFSFMYNPGAYDVRVFNITPSVGFTNIYYDGMLYEHIVKLHPELSLTLGQAIIADFLLLKYTNSSIRNLRTDVRYRGQRTVEVHPTDYAIEEYKVITER